jgi:uncharacterized protein
MGQPNQEPSMEDILASIKRIIAEESEAVGARPQRLRREAMAAVSASPAVTPFRVAPEPEPDPEQAEHEAEAEAHEPAEEPVAQEQEEALAAEPEAPAEAAEIESPDVLELTSPMPEAATQAAAAPAKPAFAPATTLDGLMSSTSAEASRNAFAALTQLQVRNEEGKSNTLEGLVSDLLRPMLKDYLDRELPGIVERLVAAEVSRLSNR